MIKAGIGILSVALALELFHIVNTRAVNLIYWDQFDFMTPFFMGSDAWTMFTWQHGPVRLGLGQLVTWGVVQLSGWNTRAEAFTILGVLFASLPLALLLKRRLLGRLQVTDLVIPLLFLNKYQWDHFIVTPIIAHSVLPLLLLLAYALAILIRKPGVRTAAILTASFLLLFTGFGLFIAPVTLVLFAMEFLMASKSGGTGARAGAVVGLAGMALSLVAFFNGYQFRPGVGCFTFQWSDIEHYPLFMGLMFAKFLGFNYSTFPTAAIGIGLLVLVGFMAAFVWSARAFLRDPLHASPTSKVICILIGFSLLYAAFTAAGRLCLGIQAAQASRYSTLLIPGFLGVVMSVSTVRVQRLSAALTLVAALLLVRTVLPFGSEDRSGIVHMSEGKTRWKECYLQTADYLGCNESTGFQIYPTGPDRWAALYPQLAAQGTASDRIIDRLRFLKLHGMNLYQDAR